ESIQEIRIQIDKFESDIESLSAQLKKKKSDKDKQERVEELKSSIERHKYHIESLEKILRAVNNDALDPKIVQHIRQDLDYYIESSQELDFKENEQMYDEIDLDDLSMLMPLIPLPGQLVGGHLIAGTQLAGLIPGELNNTSSSSTNNETSEITKIMASPTSTQSNSPSPSPSLSFSEDRRRNKSESEDYNQQPSQRLRSNSGTSTNNNGNSHTTTGTLFSTKPSSQPSSNTTNSTTSSPSSTSNGPFISLNFTSTSKPVPTLSTSAPSSFSHIHPISSVTTNTTTTTTNTTTNHFHHHTALTTASNTSTLPVLQYAAIVSQNAGTNSTMTNHMSGASKQQQILSPSSSNKMPSTSSTLTVLHNQQNNSKLTGNNDQTVATTSTITSPITTTATAAITISQAQPLATQSSLSNERILTNAPSIYGNSSFYNNNNINTINSTDTTACLTPTVVTSSSILLNRTISDGDPNIIRSTAQRLTDSSSTTDPLTSALSSQQQHVPTSSQSVNLSTLLNLQDTNPLLYQSSTASSSSNSIPSESLLNSLSTFIPTSQQQQSFYSSSDQLGSSSVPTTASSTLIQTQQTSNSSTMGSSVLSQLVMNTPINPDNLRYLNLTSAASQSLGGNLLQQSQTQQLQQRDQQSALTSLGLSTGQQQSQTTNGRVPLTPAEMRMLHRLSVAYQKLPSLLEAERQRTSTNRLYARNPLGASQVIPYYPLQPPVGSDTADFYYRLAPDTLFFIFYYMEGTRAQYLAAKALKRQSWRFHTKHMCWFQRHEEPSKITDDYEQGTYIFFDYERWQTRKRDNFVFEYKYLEDREF
ncbi:unnamed protein product, partial [Didymodactylos carnosus]